MDELEGGQTEVEEQEDATEYEHQDTEKDVSASLANATGGLATLAANVAVAASGERRPDHEWFMPVQGENEGEDAQEGDNAEQQAGEEEEEAGAEEEAGENAEVDEEEYQGEEEEYEEEYDGEYEEEGDEEYADEAGDHGERRRTNVLHNRQRKLRGRSG